MDDLEIIISKYDSKGNILEVKKANGVPIVYIWGYDEQLPIAKVENVSFTDVESAIAILNSSYNTLIKIQSLSNSDDDISIDLRDGNGNITSYEDNEGDLREALDALRVSLPLSMVTTYTYDPLIGPL